MDSRLPVGMLQQQHWLYFWIDKQPVVFLSLQNKVSGLTEQEQEAVFTQRWALLGMTPLHTHAGLAPLLNKYCHHHPSGRELILIFHHLLSNNTWLSYLFSFCFLQMQLQNHAVTVLICFKRSLTRLIPLATIVVGHFFFFLKALNPLMHEL